MAGSIPTKGAPGQRGTTTARKTTPKRAPAKKAVSKKPPGRALAVVKPAKLKTDLTPAAARTITKKIGEGYENTVKLVAKAYNGRVWIAMGHESWEQWREKEFEGRYPLALPFVARRAAAAKLRELTPISGEGLAQLTGTDRATAKRDLAAAKAGEVAQGAPPDGEQQPPLDVDEVPPEPQSSMGVDGKTYTAPPTPAPKEAGPEILSVAKAIAKELEKVTLQLTKLFDRDDYPANCGKVDEALVQSLQDFVDVVEDRLPERVSAE